MHFSIRYLTEYVYDAPVTDNLNALRVHPATTQSQRVDDFGLRVDPETRVRRHVDYFGNEVHEFGIPRPHERLAIDVRARVVTTEPPTPAASSWDALGAAAYQEAGGEFLLPAADEPEDPVIDELVDALDADSPLDAVLALVEVIPDRFQYDPDATYVGSTVADLLAAGGGVCQDFSHLALLLLRRRGIAARYVSGYFWSAPEDGGMESLEVQTHAWVQALLPDANGAGPMWLGADPTNRRLAGPGHVKIGHGRAYSDVPPIRGVFRGSATASLTARVQMQRLDPEATAQP